MVPKLEAIKGGGGSVKVGATGTISALMTRELESAKSSPQTSSPRDLKIRTASVSVPCNVVTTTPRRLQAKKPVDEASTSGSRSPEALRRAKQQAKGSHRVPMLGSDNLTMDRTPSREKKNNKKVINIVEVVDIKCGSPDRAWATPLTSKLKKLGFSKLSESVV
ncbi:unnamed protein product [Linum tenue]|uniref:Uncharacterized protein n=2 Tax=Linum TaxID=4005 RepID=A0AAV0LQ00_9ROSI|nr:unnamed protein product [Linum tenue]